LQPALCSLTNQSGILLLFHTILDSPIVMRKDKSAMKMTNQSLAIVAHWHVMGYWLWRAAYHQAEG
jgi:hypothetical protein